MMMNDDNDKYDADDADNNDDNDNDNNDDNDIHLIQMDGFKWTPCIIILIHYLLIAAILLSYNIYVN
jgi:hypothetical protein